MRKNRKTVTVLLTALAVVFACGCTKPDEPNNGGGGGNGGNNSGGGHYNGNYEYVDLGLPSGTLWATFNVGAATPEDLGDIFAWGETQPKDEYSTYNYKHGNGSSQRFLLTKYCSEAGHGYHGFTDNLTTLLPEDDAATVNWGEGWCMPTKLQCEELIDNTTPTFSYDRKGVLLTANNGKSIFLPANVYVSNHELLGYYWSSSLSWTSTEAEILHFGYSTTVDVHNNDVYEGGGMSTMYVPRYEGYLVRPVANRDGTLNGHDYVDLGLPSGTLWATCNVGSNTSEGYGDYFAWAETEAKSTYEWTNYKYCNEITTIVGNNIYYDYKLTKYCDKDIMGYNGFVDNITTLETGDDVATVRWGSGWCMPTVEQWEELQRYTTHQWTTQNGVYGRLFTSSNNKSIFLPAAGYKDSQLQEAGDCGHYWATILDYDPRAGKRIKFNSDGIQNIHHVSSCDWRYQGKTIRPVRSTH